MRRTLLPVLTALACCLAQISAAGAEPAPVAGVVERIAGEVTMTLETERRALEVGDEVYEGAILRTGPDGRLGLRFVDGTVMVMGGYGRFEIERFRSEADGADVALKMLGGAFRLLSGALAKKAPQNYEISTRVATIGVRGTHFGVEAQSSQARVLLLEQPGGGPNAIEVFNAFGRVSIDQPGFGTEIPDATSPPSPPQRMRLQLVEQLSRRAIRPPGLR